MALSLGSKKKPNIIYVDMLALYQLKQKFMCNNAFFPLIGRRERSWGEIWMAEKIQCTKRTVSTVNNTCVSFRLNHVFNELYIFNKVVAVKGQQLKWEIPIIL